MLTLLLLGSAWAGDAAVEAMTDGTVVATARVAFGVPKLPRWYDGEGYARVFPIQWRAAGIAVCWAPIYPSLGAEAQVYTLRFVVGADGRVSQLAVDDPPLPDLVTCLQLRSREWVLPAASKRPVRVEQEVSLSGVGGGEE